MNSAGHEAEAGTIASPVGDLMRGFSIEATMPARAEIDALGEVLHPGTAIYLSAPPNHSALRLKTAAREVHAAGFVPVPHIATRAFSSVDSLDRFVAELNGEAGVTRALVIAGDIERPAGPFADALSLIRSDVLQRRGLTEIGIAAYPDGSPKIPDGVLAAALSDKLEAALIRGLTVHIVTQFCFDAEKILAWLRRIRYARVEVPVRIGGGGAGQHARAGALCAALRRPRIAAGNDEHPARADRRRGDARRHAPGARRRQVAAQSRADRHAFLLVRRRGAHGALGGGASRRLRRMTPCAGNPCAAQVL